MKIKVLFLVGIFICFGNNFIYGEEKNIDEYNDISTGDKISNELPSDDFAGDSVGDFDKTKEYAPVEKEYLNRNKNKFEKKYLNPEDLEKLYESPEGLETLYKYPEGPKTLFKPSDDGVETINTNPRNSPKVYRIPEEKKVKKRVVKKKRAKRKMSKKQRENKLKSYLHEKLPESPTKKSRNPKWVNDRTTKGSGKNKTGY